MTGSKLHTVKLKLFFNCKIFKVQVLAIFAILAPCVLQAAHADSSETQVSSQASLQVSSTEAIPTMAHSTFTSSNSFIPQSKPMKIGSLSLPPKGYIEFCKENPEGCDYSATKGLANGLASGLASGLVRLNEKLINQLKDIQWEVNKTISYVSDQELYGKNEHWAYPVSAGDCEDIVLEKRRRLIALGWPADALLPATAITKGGKGIGHLVLVVTSTNGDYVLDLGTDDIQPWKKLDYKWISRKKPGKNIMWSRLYL